MHDFPSVKADTLRSWLPEEGRVTSRHQADNFLITDCVTGEGIAIGSVRLPVRLFSVVSFEPTDL